MKKKALFRAVALLVGFLALAAINGCGGGGGGGTAATPSPSITTASLPAGARTEPYSAALSAAGGKPPYTWSATGLPGGVSLDNATGALSGTPTAEGTFSPVLTVTDNAGAHASKSLDVLIAKPLTLYVADFNTPSGAVAAFDNASVADGDSAWTRRLNGALTTLDSAVGGPPAGVSVDNTRKILYVARTKGTDNGAVLAFDNAATVNGNTAPTRIITTYTIPPSSTFALISPSDVFIDSGNDRIYIADVTGPTGIVVIQDNASTSLAFHKVISFPDGPPAAIAVDVARDILYVVPSAGAAFVAYDNVYTGLDVPRTITIAATGVGLVDVKIDPATDTAYAVDSVGGRVFAYDNVSTKSGALAPDRTLTGLLHPNSLFLDVANDRLFVSNEDAGGGYSVLVVETLSSADGPVSFSRQLSGFGVAAGMTGFYR